MIYHLERTQQLNCDIHTAWKFFSSPHNLSRITPKDMNFKVVTEIPDDVYEGMIIDYTVSPLLGIPMKWRTKIIQVAENESFTDLQLKGPYKLWKHHHEFTPNDEGVLVKDSLDYELPLGILGELAHSILVKKKINHIFDFRYKVLEKMFNKQKVES